MSKQKLHPIDFDTPVTPLEVALFVRRTGLSIEEAAQILAIPKLSLMRLLDPPLPQGYGRIDGEVRRLDGDGKWVPLERNEKGEVIERGFDKDGNPLSMSMPVREPSLALLVRIYSLYPKLLPVFDPMDYFDSLKSDGKASFPLRMLSVLFGMDSSASYHWRDGMMPSRRVKQIGLLINALPRGLEDLKDLAIKEARARGVNPFKTGSWTRKSQLDGDPFEMVKRHGQRGARTDDVFEQVMQELEAEH